MRVPQALCLLSAAIGALASPTKRQSPGNPITILSPGSIVEPKGSRLGAGDSFNFELAVPEWNHCHPGYTPVDVYIVGPTQPTVDSLNSTHQFTNYLYYYGQYTINNFPGELPDMGTPPPTTLTMPDIGSDGDEPTYLATVETIFDCPPNGFDEYAIDSVPITYCGDIPGECVS